MEWILEETLCVLKLSHVLRMGKSVGHAFTPDASMLPKSGLGLTWWEERGDFSVDKQDGQAGSLWDAHGGEKEPLLQVALRPHGLS